MTCYVFLDGRFQKRNGTPVSPHMTYETVWRRYLAVFSDVVVVCRVSNHGDGKGEPMIGPGVRVIECPDYVGPGGALKSLPRLTAICQPLVHHPAAIILRTPSKIALLVYLLARRSGRPFGCEVVSDPVDVCSPGASAHRARNVWKAIGTHALRRLCATACAVSYVTNQALQKRYPPSPNAFTTACSNVVLPAAFIARKPHTYWSPLTSVRLVTVGSMAQPYKGIDVLIHTVHVLSTAGIDVHLNVIGSGQYEAAYQQLARTLGVEERVSFLGNVGGLMEVAMHFDCADVFVLASRADAMPRALIEAMARGLPCFGSMVGGIPELLPSECLFPVGDSGRLARLIRTAIQRPEWLTALAAKNIEVAGSFEEQILQRRRIEFYRAVKQQTSVWMERSKPRKLPISSNLG